MWRLVIGAPIVVLLLVILFVMTPAIASCGEHGDLVEEAVLQCPRARQLIGDDAHPARIGLACGTTETEGNYGRASWSVPFTGSRGRGTVKYDASEHAGRWTLDRATLEIDDQEIDLVSCGSSPRRSNQMTTTVLAQTNADAATATFDGKVMRSNHPMIREGATCRGELDRARGSASARVKVSCEPGGGAQAVQLYDGTGSFSLDVRDSTKRDDDRSEYDDAKTSDVDRTPGCRLSSSGATGTLTVWDVLPAYELVVEL
jgi:hypothetical protein